MEGEVIIRATTSQNLHAFFKVYETSKNQFSCSYHEGIPSYEVKEKSKLIIRLKFINGSNFSCSSFFLFIDILLKLQQQILICFCKF